MQMIAQTYERSEVVADVVGRWEFPGFAASAGRFDEE